VRVAGTEISDNLTDRKDFEGRLEAQIHGVESFIARHLESPVVVNGFESELSKGMPTTHHLPLEAVREAVRNAVAHRDYALKASIDAAIYDDRLEVQSPGQLLNTITIEAMKAGGAHLERNPLICAALAKRGFMTERGTGVHRMIRVMREHELPEPDIEMRGPLLRVVLRMKRGR
jgi:predicted HTH transcriptional regulator